MSCPCVRSTTQVARSAASDLLQASATFRPASTREGRTPPCENALTAVRSRVFPGRAGPSGAKLDVLLGRIPRTHEAPRSVYALLADHRRALFPDQLFADLFPSGRGRPSVPAHVVAMVMVLQALEGLSDRDACQQLACNITWKVACGLALTDPGRPPWSPGSPPGGRRTGRSGHRPGWRAAWSWPGACTAWPSRLPRR